MSTPLIERYRDRLGLCPATRLTLNEGSTPLVEAPAISERVGALCCSSSRRELDRESGPRHDRRRLAAKERSRGGDLCLDREHGASAAARAARAGCAER